MLSGEYFADFTPGIHRRGVIKNHHQGPAAIVTFEILQKIRGGFSPAFTPQPCRK